MLESESVELWPESAANVISNLEDLYPVLSHCQAAIGTAPRTTYAQ